MPREPTRLFPALLRHWRTRRGHSQLDLSLAAEVSSRHVSFLETGRAQPSREMVLRLATVLDLPLRDQNALLEAAGFSAAFSEATPERLPEIERALERMLAQQEPYPMVVVDHRYDVVRTNQGAARLLARTIADPTALAEANNVFRLVFDPRLARAAIVDWERTARALLSRLYRESIGDPELTGLVRALLEYPDVPSSFRYPDFSLPSEPTMVLRLRVDGEELSFLTTMTMFSAPQNVTLDELRIETYFPLDDATVAACARMAAS